MSDFRVFAGQLISMQQERDWALEVRNGRVAAFRPIGRDEAPMPGDVDARDKLVVPGFVDTHIHGGFGLDLMDGKVETIVGLARRLPSMGVTAFLVTPLTAPWDSIRKVVEAARNARRLGTSGATVIGCHLEGPFLSPKYKGAQRADEMMNPDFAALERELDGLLDEVKIVTLAPELPGAIDTIRRLSDAGIRVSVGHTNATFDEVSAAIDAGASRATHCFNAMRGLHHREPGTVGAVLSRHELVAEIIWDNIHVHPAVCKVLCATKGPDGVVAVSDGTTGVGMPAGYKFDLWGLPASVSGGAARLDDGTLAGSAIGMIDAFRNAAGHMPVWRAARLCSSAPASSLGLHRDFGTLFSDARADFVVLDSDMLTIESTYIAGERVYTSGE